MENAEVLIREIIANPQSAEDGRLANALLREFHRGYPINNLRRLLSSPEVEVVKTGVFIAAELGGKARPVLPDILSFLNHPAKWVRSDVIDSVLTCTTGRDEGEIARVVSMLNDPDPAIRWKVMEFLSRASLDQLKGALKYFEMDKADSSHTEGLCWLTSDPARNPDDIA
jgi:hypothetical protein